MDERVRLGLIVLISLNKHARGEMSTSSFASFQDNRGGEIGTSLAQMVLFVPTDYQASVPRASSCGLQRCISTSPLVLMDVRKTTSCGCC